MATEQRLIDANALLNTETFAVSDGDCKECENEYRWAVMEAPTVDAVPVVRCRECKWAEYGKDYEPYCNHWKSGLYANIKDDDFCSYGERSVP